ncbi:MAG: endonuclease domain-containing protein [Pseudonocardiaceae bacterium]
MSTGVSLGGGAGCVSARERLDEADGVAESILETAGRLVLRDRGVPLPISQYHLRSPQGALVARLDGAYLREKVALEFDGADPHGLPEAVFRDRWRQNGLPELGWTVLRFTWWDAMRDPDGVAAVVRRTLSRRAS